MPLSQVQQRPSPDPQVCAPILGLELHFPDTLSLHCGPGTQPCDPCSHSYFFAKLAKETCSKCWSRPQPPSALSWPPGHHQGPWPG